MKFLFVTRSKIGVLIPELGSLKAAIVSTNLVTAQIVLIAMIVMNLWVPRLACANSENFLETTGTGIAVGSVLGASTLPFYSQPGSHLLNMVYGASLGAVIGVGMFLYGVSQGQTDDESNNNTSSDSVRSYTVAPGLQSGAFAMAAAPTHFAIWTPVVSLTW